MRELPSIEALAGAAPERVLKLWEGLGYYHRVRNLQKAAQIVMTKHSGKLPEDFDSVLALPGIGRYTAGAICSIAFNQPTPVLDGNVVRVLARLFGIRKDVRERSTIDALWRLAEMLVRAATVSARRSGNKPTFGIQSGACSQLNQSLMELGALVCTPRQPKCELCPLRSVCIARNTGRPDALPLLRKRPAQRVCRFIAFVIEHRRRFLVRRRPDGVVNGGLWEFPNVEAPRHGSSPEQCLQGVLRSRTAIVLPVCNVKHSITRFRITLEAFRTKLKHRPAQPARREAWSTLDQIQRLPLTSAHRKILERLI
jgi:A/G-specific adenine glycosylase